MVSRLYYSGQTLIISFRRSAQIINRNTTITLKTNRVFCKMDNKIQIKTHQMQFRVYLNPPTSIETIRHTVKYYLIKQATSSLKRWLPSWDPVAQARPLSLIVSASVSIFPVAPSKKVLHQLMAEN